MLFNSIIFLIFFSAVYLTYWNLKGKIRRNFLIAASIIFYATWGLEQEGWWGLRWVLHFLFLVGVNYGLVRWLLSSSGRRKLIIRLTVVLNLSNLALFKYFDFLRQLLSDLGFRLPQAADDISIFLPLAISFYTFQMVAYAVDVYRGHITRDEGFSRYALFILFFPQLIAGPIMRASDFMEQLDHPVFSRDYIYRGCWFIMSGLVKKVLLADPMGDIVAPVFREPQAYGGSSLLLAGAAFSLQVYCDFSGYTDIARGVARLLGYKIPENFYAPFFASSARELWQRWHITLATWLRDYIYIPLGGNRLGAVRTYINLLITFTLGGLWHGADYNYVCWGAFWGVLLALERLLEKGFMIKTVPEKSRVLQGLKIAFMFFLFSLGAIMFRSRPVHTIEQSYSSWQIMLEFFGGIFKNYGTRLAEEFALLGGDRLLLEMTFGAGSLKFNQMTPLESVLAMFVALIVLHRLQIKSDVLGRWRRYEPALLILSAALLGGILMPAMATGAHQFIYFVF